MGGAGGCGRRKYLVEDVPLGAQVEVGQDAGGAHVGDRQAGLRQAHGEDGGLLALAQAGETGGEGRKAP